MMLEKFLELQSKSNCISVEMVQILVRFLKIQSLSETKKVVPTFIVNICLHR
jgi:hypothetical protein